MIKYQLLPHSQMLAMTKHIFSNKISINKEQSKPIAKWMYNKFGIGSIKVFAAMPKNMEYIGNNNDNNRNLSLHHLHFNEISLKLGLRKRIILTDTQFCSIIKEKIYLIY